MQEQVGELGLLERGAERVDQLVGQLADEADGVGEQVVAAVEVAAPGGRVEGVEEPVADATSAPVSALSSVDLPALV